ncbi:MAG: hypothetical protein KY469_18465 [Actinobacteria bacterium]|nr:hypothetical protein [Actinomycetota bacterium]
MDVKEREQVLEWIAAWRSAGEALEEERRERLRSMTPAQRREAIRAVLAVVTTEASGASPARSGLIAMQRLLARARA